MYSTSILYICSVVSVKCLWWVHMLHSHDLHVLYKSFQVMKGVKPW